MVETVHLASPIPAAGGRVVVSPFQFQTTGEDNLRLEGWSSISGGVLVVQGRRFDTTGQQQPISFKLPLSNDRVVNEHDFALGSGYLVNLVAYVEGATPLIGQVFCCVKLIRGFSGATIVLGALIQGVCTHEQVLAWPGSPLETSLAGQGTLRVFAGTAPAAGDPVVEPVPIGARWEVITVAGSFETNAVAASRLPRVRFSNGANSYVDIRSLSSQLASTTVRHFWAQGTMSDNFDVGVSLTNGLPVNSRLLAGHLLVLNADNIQAGDQFGAPLISVREWLEAN